MALRSRRARRATAAILLAVAAVSGLRQVRQLAEEPRAHGGHFDAVVSAEHAAATGLVVGMRRPGTRNLLQELLTGRPNVHPSLAHGPDQMIPVEESAGEQLQDSIVAAAAAAADLMGEDGPLVITHAEDETLIGQQVLRIDGRPASRRVWAGRLEGLLRQVAAEGVGASSRWTATLQLSDGRSVEIPARAAMVAIGAATPASLQKAGEQGAMIDGGYLYRVIPDVVLQTAPPAGRETLVPQNTEGSSAGLAYALSYLNASSGGELFAGRHIAASGQILTTGQVKAVGGFPAKGEAAVAAGTQILFVAQNSHPDAAGERRLQVVEVFQLADAVHLLCRDLTRTGEVTARLCERAEEAVGDVQSD